MRITIFDTFSKPRLQTSHLLTFQELPSLRTVVDLRRAENAALWHPSARPLHYESDCDFDNDA